MLVDFTRRVQGITELAGVQHGTRDVTQAPTEALKETRFEWHEKMLPESLVGVLDDSHVKPLQRVGTFVWERHAPGEPTEEDSLRGRDKVGIYFHGGGECPSSFLSTPLTSSSQATATLALTRTLRRPSSLAD